jgi:hypothetical protein
VLTGPVQLPFGTPARPSLSFGPGANSGISGAGSGVSVIVSGTLQWLYTADQTLCGNDIDMRGHLLQSLGDAAGPSDALNTRTADARYAPVSLASEVRRLREMVANLERELRARPVQQPLEIGRGMRTDLR